jgi:hypothetical protein
VSLSPVPLTRDEANAFIRAHHRHHPRVTGHRYIVGAESAGQLRGVAVAGRPRARRIDQKRALEVTRLATDGFRNACSFLYGICGRVARDLGFLCCFTYILESESGASLKAAGWTYRYTTRGETSDRPSRPRVDKSPTEAKQCWAPVWSPSPLELGVA